MPKGKRNWSKRERFETLYEHNHTTGCYDWIGGKNNIGYGMFRDGDKMRTAHRVSYEIYNNKTIPKYMCVCHTCDNPKCVNPSHLWLGTMKDNMDDKMRKNRHTSSMHRLGKKQPLGTCKYCNVTLPVNTIGRHHNDKCKHKPNSINTISTSVQ
jgi:hypothetical protein